jgi:hypothetical protein
MAKPTDTSDAPREGESDHVLAFTPEDDASIEDIANMVVDMMADYGMDCDVHFPMFTMEVAHGVTPSEIVAGYREILDQLAAQMTERPA